MSDKMSEEVPVTSRLASGRLQGSGVQFYLCENENSTDSVVLTLIVHVGSLMEEDDEQGMAHFIEHLGFKSTKSFEHYELVKFLESLGISYGPDLNASTHLLETMFRLNIKYDEDCSQIATGINVLSEWAYHMSISEKDVVEERQVISAEYIAKQGLSNRLLKKYWKAIFDRSLPNSDSNSESLKLATRFPIGIPEIFMNCSHHQIREFYEKWYRPENMSVLVCGSLHGRQSEIIDLLEKSFMLPSTSVVKTHLVDFPSQCEKLQHEHLILPSFLTPSDVVVAMVDSDLSSTQICFEFFSPIKKSKSMAFIRQDLLRRVMSSILDRRFSEMHKNRGNVPSDAIGMSNSEGVLCSPFLSVQISIREFVRGLVCIGVSATLKSTVSIETTANPTKDNFPPAGPTELDIAIQSLLLEMKRLRTLGVNDIELDKAKSKWLLFFTQQQNKKFNDNAYMASELQNYVLNAERVPFATPADEASICIELIKSITIEDVNAFLSQTFDMDVPECDSIYYSSGDREHSFRSVSGQFPMSSAMACCDDNLRQVLEECRAIIGNVNSLQEWPSHVQIEESRIVDFAQMQLDCAEGVAESSITKETFITSLNSTEYVLSNGITVCCKWLTEESQGKVSMQGFALGGSSELNPLEDLLMSGLDEIAGNSKSTFLKSINCSEGIVLEGKDVLDLQSVVHTRVNTQRHQHHRGIGGSATTDKLELLFAFLVIKMTGQCLDKQAFDDWIHKKQAHLVNQSNPPEYLFMNKSRILACGDEPNFRPVCTELVEEASNCFELACQLYDRAFKADPTEFTFVFTGDIGSEAQLKELMTKYLGRLRPNLEACDRNDTWLSHKLNALSPTFHPFSLLESSAHVIDGPIEESMGLLNTEDDKSSMMLIFRADMRSYLDDDDDLLFSTSLDVACRLLQVYLLDELRIKFGKVYNVNVEKSRNSLCTFFLVSIGLHCQQADIDFIQQSIRTVISHLRSQGPDLEKLKNISQALCKSHSDNAKNSSFWLFWMLDSYKSYDLHKWRCEAHPDSFSFEESSDWLERNGDLRALGKAKLVKESITCASLQQLYLDVFDMDKSIIMKLCPKPVPSEENEEEVLQKIDFQVIESKEKEMIEV